MFDSLAVRQVLVDAACGEAKFSCQVLFINVDDIQVT